MHKSSAPSIKTSGGVKTPSSGGSSPRKRTAKQLKSAMTADDGLRLSPTRFSKGSSSPSPRKHTPKSNQNGNSRTFKGSGGHLTLLAVPEEGDSPGSRRLSKMGKSPKSAGSGSKKERPLNQKLRKLTTAGQFNIKPLCQVTEGEQSIEVEGAKQPEPVEKDSDADSSDVESMLKEMDPAKRHIKQLKLKRKQMENSRPKPLPRLSYEQRGWNAPLDEPYVPVGHMTELVTAIEQVRQNLPHTRDRFKKQTYRQMLMVKKRERDTADRQPAKKEWPNSRPGSTGPPKSQGRVKDLAPHMEGTSRVVTSILPQEKSRLVQIRSFAHDETLREMRERRQSAPAGPRVNKFGRMAAGYVTKKNEKKDEAERKRKWKEAVKRNLSMADLAKKEGESSHQVMKSDIEIQMEKEKERHWIRERNGRIYDEKIKNLILTTDNGSALLKEEIQESELRLAAIKLGRPLKEVVPPHPEDYFLTNKEDYFLGEQRILRRQEREEIARKAQAAQDEEEPRIVQPEKAFQTIGSSNELYNLAHQDALSGGFFLTEQPLTVPQHENKPLGTGFVRIPDLLESHDVLDKGKTIEEPVKVSQMFSKAHDTNFEKVYRATTQSVKSMFLRRVKSREHTAAVRGSEQLPYGLQSEQGMTEMADQSQDHNNRYSMRHQRANSMSTAAATTGFGGKKHSAVADQGLNKVLKNRMSDSASHTLNMTVLNDSSGGRLLSAQTALTGPASQRRIGSISGVRQVERNIPAQQNGRNQVPQKMMQRQRGQSQYMVHSNDAMRRDLRRTAAQALMNESVSIVESTPLPTGLGTAETTQIVSQGAVDNRMLISSQDDQQSLRQLAVGSQSMTQLERGTQQLGPKRLLKDAKSRRAHNMSQALQKDVGIQRNRVRYLQSLQKERIAQKKLDQAGGSNIFQGFSQEEIHEILVEMPQLKKMEKEKRKLKANGPEPPTFSNSQLIHLDSLNDIANRGQAELRQKVMQQIENRKKRIDNDMQGQDDQYGFEGAQFATNHKAGINRSNVAIMKKFQQNTQDGYEEELDPAYNFHDQLKERLDYADARQQSRLCHAFKNEDFANKVLDPNQPTENNQASHLSQSKCQDSETTSGLRRHNAFFDRVNKSFMERQQSLNGYCTQPADNHSYQRQTGSSMSQGKSGKHSYSHQSTGLMHPESQRQVDDELREFDHSDQVILTKLIEVFEARMTEKRAKDAEIAAAQALAKQKKRLARGSTLASVTKGGPQEPADPDAEADDLASLINGAQDQAIVAGIPTLIKNAITNKIKGGNRSSMQIANGGGNDQDLAKPKLSARAQKKAMHTSMVMQTKREKMRQIQLKKDYRKFVIEQITKEYWRAFEALVGCTDIDLELVTHSISLQQLYKEAKDFMVTKAKSISEDHLIHLKEDPKTIVSLYRMFMLHYRTSQMAQVEKKLYPPRKPGQKGSLPPPPSCFVAPSTHERYKEDEDSDYSESDFQDLMSNKQIEENIRVFFDRIHELVNPIDEQRLKLDSVQQIKATVKTFYKRKADLSDKLLQELDQMSSERPALISVKQAHFNEPEVHNQANLHAASGLAGSTDGDLYPEVPPTQQCQTRMTDIRLNAELYRMRRFKAVAEHTANWFNDLATQILAEGLQDEPLVRYMLDQIKHVIEMGNKFTRKQFKKLMATFDPIDAGKAEVQMVSYFLDQLLPYGPDDAQESQDADQAFSQGDDVDCEDSRVDGGTVLNSHQVSFSALNSEGGPESVGKRQEGNSRFRQNKVQDEAMVRKFATQQQRGNGRPPKPKTDQNTHRGKVTFNDQAF